MAHGNKSLSALARKYRGKPKKFADGGSVRRPAAAPVGTPYDPDFIERLAARAIGSGEPVPELRSAEGRGFAPTPFQGEGFQRMSAMLRGEVEPTPGEQMGLNIVRGFTEGPASIRAYHGSPHRFDRFDISKIGTGEGATAYGRGLYFAGNEGVARTYRDKSVGRRLIGGESPNFSRFDHYASSMDQMYGSRAKAIKAIKENAENGFGVDVAADAIRLLRSKQKLPEISYSPGHMYEVRLRTTPEELVNWDAPLVRQPERAVPFLEDVLRAPRTGSARVLEREMKPIGEAIDLRTPEIAAQLREAGIPGLRYLDAGSRTGRQNTRNYVMFGDDLIDITRRYAEGGLAALDAKYADGGTVRAPKEATIRGQGHELAYITPEEAALLKARGGSGRMTRYGVPAFDDGNGGNGGDGNGGDGSNGSEGGNGTGEGNEGATSQDAAMSEAATQDAVGGNQGQGAGPTGAGAGGGPSSNDPGPTGEGQSEVSTPGMAPGISTTPTAFGPIGPEDEANAAAARDAIANAPIGFEAYGVRDAIDAYNSGRMGLAQAIGYGLANVAAPPGFGIGFNVDPQTQMQTPALSFDPVSAVTGLGLSAATGFAPGMGMIGGMIGSQISQAMGMTPGVVDLGTFGVTAPSMASQTPGVNAIGSPAGALGSGFADIGGDVGGGDPGAMGGGDTGMGATADGGSDQGIDQSLSALNQRYSEQLSGASAYTPWNWAQIQRDAEANNQTLDQYLARNWGNLATNAPRLMKHGGMVEGKKSLEELHHRYAEGGEVGDEGMVRPYDPREVDTIASEFMREISPVDVTQRARMLMRGLDVKTPMVAGAEDLPENYMRYPRNENVTSSTNYFEIPIEDDRYGQRAGMRGLNTGINAILDQERKIGIGAGLTAMETAGDYGMTGYGPRVSASYGPASIFGGYQTMTPSFTGAKPQGVYSYGGNLNIPLDEEGTTANIGGSIMSGRRGTTGMGNAGTQITGGLQVPLERLFPESNIGGTLGLDVAVDPTLRQKEILFGYRRAF